MANDKRFHIFFILHETRTPVLCIEHYMILRRHHQRPRTQHVYFNRWRAPPAAKSKASSGWPGLAAPPWHGRRGCEPSRQVISHQSDLPHGNGPLWGAGGERERSVRHRPAWWLKHPPVQFIVEPPRLSTRSHDCRCEYSVQTFLTGPPAEDNARGQAGTPFQVPQLDPTSLRQLSQPDPARHQPVFPNHH